MNIAITAEGIVSAIGTNKAEVLRSLREGRSGIGQMRHLPSSHTELPVGEVPLTNDELKARLSLPLEEEISRTSLLGIAALSEALGEARLTPDDRQLRIVLINGTTVGGMDLTERHYSEIRRGLHTETLRQHDCGSCTDQMARHFGLFSDSATISTACSSAANAMVLGANLLKAGLADIVVAGGTEALSVFHLNGFRSLMILDHDRCRPFDATRAGLNLGEGAAFVVMESEELARKRGAEVHAWLTGYGNRCDAFHQTASSPDGEGATQAMTEALRMAGLRPQDIQYINAHGTGTPDNDLSESHAIRRVFSSCLPPVSSTKGLTGHTTSASGSIEAVIALLAMREGFIPGNAGWSTPMADGIRPTLGEDTATLHNVLSNSFGFGGNDTALVFSDQPQGSSEDIAPIPQDSIKILAKVEIGPDDDLSGIRQYVRPIEARRLGRLMKATLLSSLKALEEAGVACPDAIVTATRFGCLDNSEHLLEQLEAEGEASVKPTWFMQSTHNTLSSAIAIQTGCHGYNMTYTHGQRSDFWALRDAHLLLATGRYRTVLVGCHDEASPVFAEAYRKATGESLPSVSSWAMVLTRDKD